MTIALVAVCEVAIVLLLALLFQLFSKEKGKNYIGKQFGMIGAEEHRLIYQISTDDLRHYKSQQWAVSNYVILLQGGITGALLVLERNIDKRLILLVDWFFVWAAYVIGIRLLFLYYLKQREQRIGLYKHTYKLNGSSIDLFRASAYWFSDDEYERRKRKDFSYRPDGITILFAIVCTASLAINLVIATIKLDP